MKKVAIIGTAGVPARYGGFETLAHHLVKQLKHKCSLHVYCSTKYYKKEERKSHFNGAKLHHIPLNANGATSIIYDIFSIIHALFYANTLVILGVSGGIIIPLVRWFTNKTIIVNIDGLEWRRAKWNGPIKKFLKFSEALAVKYSHADITDNEAIQKYTAIHYKTLSYLVAYGADHVAPRGLTPNDYTKYPFLFKPYAFKVCRIEPENNVHIILETYAQLEKHTLIIVGNWKHSLYGKNLKAQYKHHKNIHLLDPIYDQIALDKLRSNCDLYLHGHSAGGTNPSLVEAMYLGLPILAFDVSYNKATTEQKAFYFKNKEQLTHLIQTTKNSAFKNMAQEMKTIADRRYTWKAIAQKYYNLIISFDYAYKKNTVIPNIQKLPKAYFKSGNTAHLLNTTPFYE